MDNDAAGYDAAGYEERIARLESQVRYLLNYLELDPDITASGVTPFPRSVGAMPPGGMPAGGMPPVPPGDMFPPDFYDYLRRGKLINAIKIYREVTGVSLADARAAVQAMARQMR
jgi:hypothetical protein